MSAVRFLLCAAALLLQTGACTADVLADAVTSRPQLSIDSSPTTNPWTSLSLNNDPMNFQFAIVTDRSGGVRAGIFEDAVTKLNLLQPEFVMSVGDLIAGYTRDEIELDRQWDEFEGFVNRLKMPFFYVPGNHDLANPLQKREWTNRFGRSYYHFVYGNVLFLCLNSEDPARAMSAEQVEYFRKVLEENRDVRWTLAFLHRPLWTEHPPQPAGNTNGAAQESGWEQFERLLQGRRHTVFAGHLHHYTKHTRNNSSYIVLATTGGGSPLRGARPYGEFDHVCWVTMTDNGPILANLELDGIWDENVMTVELARLVNPLLRSGVQSRPLATEPLPFRSTTTSLRLTNHADIPLTMTLEFALHPQLRPRPARLERVIPPNSVEFADIRVGYDGQGRPRESMAPLELKWRGEYAPPGQERIGVDGTHHVTLDPMEVTFPRTRAVAIDGKLDEWTSFPVKLRQPAAVIGKRGFWGGPRDGQLEYAVEYDDQFVYVGVRVQDDRLVAADATTSGDFLEIRMSPHGLSSDAGGPAAPEVPQNPKRAARRAARLAAGSLRVALAPGRAEDGATTSGQPRGAAVRTRHGYTAEAAFPIDALQAEQEGEWKSFRLNLGLHDQDRPGRAGVEEKTLLWWRPTWGTPADYPNSGTFLRR